jgi:CDGSH-type Zn-finger protein
MIKNKKRVSGQYSTGHHPADRAEKKDHKVLVTKNGPYLVSGGLPLAKEVILTDDDGISNDYGKGDSYPGQETYALCRCGGSKHKPFCDGTHEKINFDGTETARKKKYFGQAEKIQGPGYVLTDVPDLCAAARFCHQAGGIWRLAGESDDPGTKGLASHIAGQCPSGRLVVWDAESGKPIEPEMEPSISLVEDPEKGVSGPIWVKGGVPVESENGTKYEVRERVTLCRCGQSVNKPFCDGTHISCGFDDGDSSLR